MAAPPVAGFCWERSADYFFETWNVPRGRRRVKGPRLARAQSTPEGVGRPRKICVTKETAKVRRPRRRRRRSSEGDALQHRFGGPRTCATPSPTRPFGPGIAEFWQG